MNPSKPTALFLILLISMYPVTAMGYDWTDGWTSSGSSSEDQTIWGGYSVKFRMTSVDSYTDCICFDWYDDGGSGNDETFSSWNHCQCRSSTVKSHCMASSSWINSICGRGDCWVDSSMDAWHAMDSGSSGDRWKNIVDVRYYKDCDDSSNQQGIWNINPSDPGVATFYVVYPKKIDCDSGNEYDYEGKFTSSTWVDYNSDNSCGSGKACDEYYDDVEITTATGSIPDPCRMVEGAGDCDQDSDCFYGMHCSEAGFTDRCCPNGEEWIDGQCRIPCTEGYTNNYRCSGDMRQREYQFEDCDTEWRNVENCNDDDVPWWYYCESNCIKKQRIDGYCSSSVNDCRTQNYYETLSCKGDGDYCADRNSHQEACGKCGYGDYDCDFDYECATAAPDCVDTNGGACGIGAECGCCYTGDTWSETLNQCCTDHDYIGCYGDNEKWWYDSCGQPQDYIEDCDSYDQSSWTYFCENNCIKKKRKDYYCSSGGCSYTWQTEVLSCKGDGDYCADRNSYQEACGKCGYGDYDCDADYECAAAAPDCVDTNGDACGLGAECGCCGWGDTWSETLNQCCEDEDHTGCIGNEVYWYDSCNQLQEQVEDCDDQDGDWEYYCTDDCIKKKYKNYYCTGGACTYDWVYQTVSCKGDEDYCGHREDHQEACGKCGYEDWDCDDYVIDECASGLDCKGTYLDTPGDPSTYDGCCDPDETYDQSTHECCTKHDHYGCDGDDIYWVDSCGQQNDHVQDCSELDTDWEFYCEGDCLDKKYKDYTCTGGACTYSWHEEEESCRGDGDYCAKRDDHQEACGKCEYDDFDCDADYECAASAPDCADANGGACGLGAECGCCYTGDYWSESQDMCCTAEDHKGCVGNDVYWYDRCGAQGQLVEDCDDSDGEEYFCQDDCIKKSILDYSCIGEGECVSASAPILISCDGDASYCSDRSAHPEACGTCDHGQYECELDSHCDWDLDCVDIDNECQAANECGCCYPGEIWLEATDLCYMPPDCGDNICEPGEYCPEDCIELNGFISPPSEVAAGEEVTLNIEVHNTGDQIMSIFVEASIVPEYWADYGLIPDDGKGVHWYPPGCCPENEYYNTSVVGLSAGETYSFPLTINAPTEESMDGCGNLSAWGPEFKLLAGLYIECQGGYSDYVMHDIAVHESEECNYNDICDPGETPENCRDDCPCLINGACEPEWETPENCRDDCRCNHDDVCDPQWEDINNCPDDCAAGCDIPDGSTWYCDCDSDADCIPHGDYYCNQVSGPDACEEISWQDECSNHNDYFCEYGWVKQCIDAGTHWVKEYIENCNGLYEYCDPTVVDGTGSCSVYDHDIWIDHADTGVRVNKQPGDKMRLNIYSATAGTVDVDFFTGAFSGYCYGSWSIGQGITTCDMLVDELAENGDYELTVDNKIAHVTITDQPEFLIVTDSEKLYERFPHEDNGVRAVLKQAYVNAKEDGVVYDLSWYEEDIGIAGLFESLAEYHEELTLPHEMDNSYQEAVADFIKEMCDDCMDVMIVGDDFVVPYYRNPITVDYNWFPWLHDQVQHNIYTDQHFIQVKGAPPIKELDKIFTADGHADKQVMFILPDDVSPDMRESIDTLKLVIETKFHTDDIPEKAGSELILGDYGVPGTTLVIIGTADNNPALRYYPFAIANDYDMYIDRNLWDPNRAFMQSEEYALIMVIDSAFLLDLNSGAIWSEMYKEVEGEAINWWMMAGGAALVIVSPFTGPAAPFVAVAGIAILSADTVDNCLIENQAGQNWDECSVDIIIDIATVGIFKVVGKYAKPLTERFGKEATEQIITRLIKLGKYINPKALAAVAKQGDELLNLKLISRGVKSAAGESDEILERFVKNMPNSMDDMAKNGFFRDLGKIAENYGDDIADDLVQLGDVPGVDRLTKNVVVGQEGFKFEARSARILKDKGIKELSKKIDNGEIDMLMKNYDVWDAKQGWGTLTRNNPQWGDITDGWNTQISKYKQFISNSPNPSGKVHFVFDSHVSDDVMEFLLEKGVKVKKIINGEVLNG